MSSPASLACGPFSANALHRTPEPGPPRSRRRRRFTTPLPPRGTTGAVAGVRGAGRPAICAGVTDAAAPSAEPLDLVVVGGGVNGAGIARDAAGRGWRVLLLEAGDLAGATSSRSSKLIHGGLRYLEYYEFRLVRESLQERETLLRSAPHLVTPLRFVLPHHDGLRPAWMLRAGLFLYDHIGGRRSLPGTTTVDLRRDPLGAPLRQEFRRGFAYSDCWVDDARLVALLAVDARERGARVLTRTAFTGARRTGALWRVRFTGEDGATEEVAARAVVNAAGPWVDEVLRSTGANAPGGHKVRLVKGSHVVLPKLYDGGQCYTLQGADGRVIFTIPYQSHWTLVGTTDVPFEGDPREVRISEEETAYLCRFLGDYFTRPVAPDEVAWSYSGVRPLADSGQVNASAVTRDYAFDLDAPEGAAPSLSVFGGKLTTFRKLAEHALRDLGRALGDARPAWTGRGKVPGGDLPGDSLARFVRAVRRERPWLPPDTARRMAMAYGSRLPRVLDGASSWADMGRDFGAGLTEREAEWMRADEWAKRAEDVLWRRSKLGLHMTPDQRDAFAAWFEG